MKMLYMFMFSWLRVISSGIILFAMAAKFNMSVEPKSARFLKNHWVDEGQIGIPLKASRRMGNGRRCTGLQLWASTRSMALFTYTKLIWNASATKTMSVTRKSDSTVPTWSYTLCLQHLIFRLRSSLWSLSSPYFPHDCRMITVIIFQRNPSIFSTSPSTFSEAQHGTRAKLRCCAGGLHLHLPQTMYRCQKVTKVRWQHVTTELEVKKQKPVVVPQIFSDDICFFVTRIC